MEAMDLQKLVLITPLVLMSLDYSEKASEMILTVNASLER